MGTSSINGPFSMAMLNDQMVDEGKLWFPWENELRIVGFAHLCKHLQEGTVPVPKFTAGP